MPTQAIRIWDLPTRLFHWLLVLTIGFSWVTASIGGNWMVWHERSGIFILSLLVFRIVWGVMGSDTARFSQFVKSPRVAWQHWRELQGQSGTAFHLGHNPLGAWMVLALLLVLLAQGVTGLFATDDIMTEGPLMGLVTAKTAKLLTSIHHTVFDGVLLLVMLHVAAIVFYRWRKRTNLIRAMVVGKADWDLQQPVPTQTVRFQPASLGLLVFLSSYALVYFLIQWLATLG